MTPSEREGRSGEPDRGGSDDTRPHVFAFPPPSNCVYFPWHASPERVTASLAIHTESSRSVWLIGCAPALVTDQVAARLAATVVVHQSCPIAHPMLNPRLEVPALLLLGTNGLIGDRRQALPSGVLAEIDRVADVLKTHHAEYVANVAKALSGHRPAEFAPLPVDLGISDPANESAWAPLPPSVAVNVRRLAPFNDPDSLFHFVDLDYRTERYLENCTDEELLERAEDAIVNTHNFEEPGRLLIDLSDTKVARAAARLGEAVAELKLRHGENATNEMIKTLAPRWKLPPIQSPLIQSVIEFIRTTDLRTVKDGLVRYDNHVWLSRLLETGELQLSPASSFTDSSLNRAQKANELELTVEIDTRRTRFEILNEDRSNSLGFVEPTRAQITKKAPTDYYVWCSSRRLTARLFFDFERDACLVIRDRHEFMRRLTAAAAVSLPGWQVVAADLVYYDPFSKDARRASIPFYKHIRYEYQAENRVVLSPPKPHSRLKHLLLRLGPLNDIATLFVPERSGDGAA